MTESQSSLTSIDLFYIFNPFAKGEYIFFVLIIDNMLLHLTQINLFTEL